MPTVRAPDPTVYIAMTLFDKGLLCVQPEPALRPYYGAAGLDHCREMGALITIILVGMSGCDSSNPGAILPTDGGQAVITDRGLDLDKHCRDGGNVPSPFPWLQVLRSSSK